MKITCQQKAVGLAALIIGYAIYKKKKTPSVGEKKYPKLREVEVTYSDGTVIGTSMAAHLTDDDIRNYFKVGRSFNIGNGALDKIVKVEKVDIIF